MMGFEWCRWQASRECGSRYPRRAADQTLHSHLYSGITVVRSWNPSTTADHQHHGGVFGCDFSLDGSLLVTACENKSILMFDPLNGQLINHRSKAHLESVNCVRFLDNRVFATCSDDTTVKLWDARFLKKSIRVLQGHANWVKNIEYASQQGALVTSGFDGAIYKWNINEYCEEGTKPTQLFKMDGLMRAVLCPDGSKLIISSMGYLMVVHNLDLDMIEHDLRGFKPNLYRLVQMGEQPHIKVDHFNRVFERRRNRVELISDFPGQDDADMISSIQVHPQGWCVVSRNTTSDENSEWTCIHDVQEKAKKDTDEFISPNSSHKDSDDKVKIGEKLTTEAIINKEPTADSTTSGQIPGSDNPSPTSTGSAGRVSDAESLGGGRGDGAGPSGVRWVNVSITEPLDLPETSVSVEDEAQTDSSPSDSSGESENQENDSEPGSSPSSSPTSATEALRSAPSPRLAQILMYIIRSGSPSVSARTIMFSGAGHTDTSQRHHLNSKIYKNSKHLTHYIQEPNVGTGYIKEMCFSSDGRLVCSPFAYGVRLLAFNPQCQELCDCVPQQPQQLYEVACNISHSNHVMTANFSPTHCLLVSGCLNGKVDFHQPQW